MYIVTPPTLSARQTDRSEEVWCLSFYCSSWTVINIVVVGGGVVVAVVSISLVLTHLFQATGVPVPVLAVVLVPVLMCDVKHVTHV